MESMPNIYTASEADKKWGLIEGTVRQSCRRGKLRTYVERGLVKKSGRVWLISEQVMKEVFGEPKKD